MGGRNTGKPVARGSTGNDGANIMVVVVVVMMMMMMMMMEQRGPHGPTGVARGENNVEHVNIIISVSDFSRRCQGDTKAD